MTQTPTPADVRDALQVAQRLNHADLWADAVRVYRNIAAAQSAALTGEPAVEAAWAAFQDGNLTACREFLKRAPEQMQQTAMLTRACDAMDGDHSAYHALVAEAMHGTPHPIQNVTALLVAQRRGDLDTAGVLARRVLAVAPSHAEAWMALAVNSAVHGQYADAVGAVNHARSDRYPHQTDPAVTVTGRVVTAASDEVATTLTAAGALLDPDRRTGWDGWAVMLRRHLSFRFTGFDVALAAFLITAATVGLVLFGMPFWQALASSALILTVVHFTSAARSTTDGAGRAPLRLEALVYRAWLVGLTRALRARVSGWATRTPGDSRTRLLPDRCVCHLNAVITGEGAQEYLSEHLQPVPEANDRFGYTLLHCPVIGRAFIQPDGLTFAMVAPDEVGPAAPKRPEPVKDSDRLTGQYL